MDIIDYILISLLALCAIAMLILLILGFKNNNAFKQTQIIINAIYNYHLSCISNRSESLVEYEDMKPYDNVWLNLFDWGYTNILPKEKFEIIKPFIMEERK